MYSGDQQKPLTIYKWGPETEPQLKNQYHGMGTPHSLVYTSNPVSWLVSAGELFPFSHIGSANAQIDRGDREALDELQAVSPVARVVDFGGVPDAVASPRSARKNPLVETAIGGGI